MVNYCTTTTTLLLTTTSFSLVLFCLVGHSWLPFLHHQIFFFLSMVDCCFMTASPLFNTSFFAFAGNFPVGDAFSSFFLFCCCCLGCRYRNCCCRHFRYRCCRYRRWCCCCRHWCSGGGGMAITVQVLYVYPLFTNS